MVTVIAKIQPWKFVVKKQVFLPNVDIVVSRKHEAEKHARKLKSPLDRFKLDSSRPLPETCLPFRLPAGMQFESHFISWAPKIELNLRWTLENDLLSRSWLSVRSTRSSILQP